MVRLNKSLLSFGWLLLFGALLILTACGRASSSSTDFAAPTTGNNPGANNPPGKNNLPPGNNGSANSGGTASNPGGGLPQLSSKPNPQTGSYQGCPPQGDGGDKDLNVLKNRTDMAAWYPVAINSILSLSWPPGIGGKRRATWSPAETAEIARYEGIPVQLEGWLAGAKQEGPESPNCHAQDDVDNHLWIVDDPRKDRSKSVVVEITPRVRSTHPGWAFERVSPLVDGKTKVRISGWLMLDQEHPDQVNKTRGTIWEVHPIVLIEVQKNEGWVSLDTGKVFSLPGGKAALPTSAPFPEGTLESPEEAGLPTATARPSNNRSGGRPTASGPVKILDIAFNGVGGSAEAGEYVEIENNGSTPINMDGWILRDVYGGEEFTWQNFILKPGVKIRVYTNENHPETGGFSFGSNKAIWANKGDAAELIDAGGKVVSSFAYGNRR